MDLEEMLGFVTDRNCYIGLSYVGQNDYTITTKKEIFKEEDLLHNKVASINAFKNKDRRILGIKVFKKF